MRQRTGLNSKRCLLSFQRGELSYDNVYELKFAGHSTQLSSYDLDLAREAVLRARKSPDENANDSAGPAQRALQCVRNRIHLFVNFVILAVFCVVVSFEVRNFLEQNMLGRASRRFIYSSCHAFFCSPFLFHL